MLCQILAAVSLAKAPEGPLLPVSLEFSVLDESLAFVGWELLPAGGLEAWRRESPARRKALQADRAVAPGERVELVVFWELIDRVRGARQLQIELKGGQHLQTFRFPWEGLRTPPVNEGSGRLVEAVFPLEIPSWPEPGTVEIWGRLLYEDPNRSSSRWFLGVLPLSSWRGAAWSGCLGGRWSGWEQVLAVVEADWYENAARISMPPCLCELPSVDPCVLAACAVGVRDWRGAALRFAGALVRLRWNSLCSWSLHRFARGALRAGRPEWQIAIERLALRLAPDFLPSALTMRGLEPRNWLTGAWARPILSIGASRWQGASGGALLANGTAALEFLGLAGPSRVEISVRGQLARGKGPRLSARLNGEKIDALELLDEKERLWGIPVVLRDGKNFLEVEFENDEHVESEDRNAFLGAVTIRSLERP